MPAKGTVKKCKLPRPKVSHLEEEFAIQLKGWVGHDHFTREWQFQKGRRWKFDFAFLHSAVAVEIEGGTWSGGRHTRGKGFEDDCEKYSHAALTGWMVGRFTGSQVKSGAALEWVKRALLERAK